MQWRDDTTVCPARSAATSYSESIPFHRNSNVRGSSAYPPRLSVNADIPARRPSATSGREQSQQLFDHFVGTTEESEGKCNAERLRGFEVQKQLEFGRLLHRQVSRTCSLENSTSIGAR
jgi:hypothetical protein